MCACPSRAGEAEGGGPDGGGATGLAVNGGDGGGGAAQLLSLRCQLRQLLMAGDTAAAQQLLQQQAPGLLAAAPGGTGGTGGSFELQFHLACQQYIELIRQASGPPPPAPRACLPAAPPPCLRLRCFARRRPAAAAPHLTRCRWVCAPAAGAASGAGGATFRQRWRTPRGRCLVCAARLPSTMRC